MMKASGLRLVLLIAVAAVLQTWATAASEPVEVGYIEDIKGNPGKMTIRRADKDEPVVVCGLVYNDDRITVRDPRGRISLRISGRMEPLVIGPELGEFRLEAAEPKRSFLSGLVRWAVTNISDLDRKARNPVQMSVRDGSNGPLSLPLLAERQLVGSGERALSISWEGASSIADVKITNAAGQIVASGRGRGRIWTSPTLDLQPGEYRVELSTSREIIDSTIEVVPISALPQVPSDLNEQGIPQDLRAAVTATWMASQSRKYSLEAFQLIAEVADRSAPAGLVADALVSGQAIKDAR